MMEILCDGLGQDLQNSIMCSYSNNMDSINLNYCLWQTVCKTYLFSSLKIASSSSLSLHFEMYVVHTPTNALFISLVKSFKFTFKYTVISLLRVWSLMTIIRELYLYLTKIIFMLKPSVKFCCFIYIYIY